MLGKKIKELRLSRNMNQEEFGKKILHTKSTISKWENGSSIPDIITLQKISEVFEVDINTIVGDKRIEKKQVKKDELILSLKDVNYTGIRNALNLENKKKRLYFILGWSFPLIIGIGFFIGASIEMSNGSSYGIAFRKYLILLLIGTLLVSSSVVVGAIHFRLSDKWARDSRKNVICDIYSNAVKLTSKVSGKSKSFEYSQISNIKSHTMYNKIDLFIYFKNDNKLTLFGVDETLKEFFVGKGVNYV